jgi:hypothetical protein
MTNHLDSKNLVPFRPKRNGYRLPGMAGEEEEQVIESVDPDLRPDERGFVRYYLGYADVFLSRAHEEEETEEEDSRQPDTHHERRHRAA